MPIVAPLSSFLVALADIPLLFWYKAVLIFFPSLVPVIAKSVVVLEMPLVVKLEFANALPVLTSYTVFVIPLVVTLDLVFRFPPSSYTVSVTPVYVTADIVLLTLSDSDGFFPPLTVVVIPAYEISFLV